MKNIILILVCFTLYPTLFAQQAQTEKSSIHEASKNSIYFEFGGLGLFGSINYDRVIPVAEQLAIVPRAGFAILGDFFPVYEINLLYGGSNHFLETGFGQYLTTAWPSDFMIRVGYRYHGNRGLHFRVAPLLYRETVDEGRHEMKIYFAVSTGYTF